LNDVIAEGDHTRVKTMVTSKVGGLTAFTTKKETCIGCKTPLDQSGRMSLFDNITAWCTYSIRLDNLMMVGDAISIVKLRYIM